VENLSYVAIFRQRWRAICTAILLGVVSAAIVAFSLPPTYSSTATLFLVVKDPNATLAERSQFSLARVSSYTELIRSSDVLQPAITRLDLDLTVQELSNRVSATNPNNTVNIDITAEAGSAPDASAIANAGADSLSRLVARVENVGTFSVSLERLIPALTPTSPSAPQKAVILGLGLLSGLAGGATIALLLARFDRRIHSVAGIRRTTGLAVLGAIPPWRSLRSRDHEHREFDAAVAEAVSRIAQVNGGGMPRLLLLVPTGAHSDAPQLRWALATAIAETGRQALLVESDALRVTSHPLGEFAGELGLADLLAGTATLPEVIRSVDGSGALVVPAGIATPTEIEVESSFRVVVTRLLSDADALITQVDLAASPVSIPLVAPYADVSLIVVRHRHSTEQQLAQAVSQLRIAGMRPIGVMLVDVRGLHRSELMATWVPEDFAGQPSKALITPRRSAATRKPPLL